MLSLLLSGAARQEDPESAGLVLGMQRLCTIRRGQELAPLAVSTTIAPPGTSSSQHHDSCCWRTSSSQHQSSCRHIYSCQQQHLLEHPLAVNTMSPSGTTSMSSIYQHPRIFREQELLPKRKLELVTSEDKSPRTFRTGAYL